MREVLTGHTKLVRRSEIPRRDHDSCGGRFAFLTPRRLREHPEGGLPSLDARDALVLPHRDAEMPYDSAVVREAVAARGFVGGDHKRHAAERELLRRREEAHVGGILRDGTADDL